MENRYDLLEWKGTHSFRARIRGSDPEQLVFVKRTPLQGAEAADFFNARGSRVAASLGMADNLLPLIDSGESTDGSYYSVFPYIPLNLGEFLHAGPISVARARRVLHDILTGIGNMHQVNCVHRNLNLSSVLIEVIDPQNVRAIVDGYQLSRPKGCLEHKLSPLRDLGILRFKAPELLLGQRDPHVEEPEEPAEEGMSVGSGEEEAIAPEVVDSGSDSGGEQVDGNLVTYSYGVDIWACACLFVEMITGAPLFATDDDTVHGQVLSIFHVLGTPTTDDWPCVHDLPGWSQIPELPAVDLAITVPPLADSPFGLDLLGRMLQLDPGSRLSAAQCLSHPFFAGLDAIVHW